MYIYTGGVVDGLLSVEAAGPSGTNDVGKHDVCMSVRPSVCIFQGYIWGA